MPRAKFLAVVVSFFTLLSCADAPDPNAVLPNDNVTPGGEMSGRVLSISLEARNGTWRPEGNKGPALDSIAAFAEEGGPLSTPGPLIRVAVGREVRGTVKNTLARPLTVFGLGKTRGFSDSIVVAPGAASEFRFTAEKPGTYYYFARSGRDPFGGRLGMDTQLHGILVIDDAHPVPDRVMAISWFAAIDLNSPSGLERATMAINGLSWPHTERLQYQQGDSITWRVVNFTEVDHPMHLHGFYFRVDSKGNGITDSLYTPEQQRMAVTEPIVPMQTMTLSWMADRPGNWIYHCHYAGHLSNLVALDTKKGALDESLLNHHKSDGPHQMFGLVMGLNVAANGDTPAPADAPRAIRIVQRERPNVYGSQPGMSFVLDGTPEAADSVAMPVPGPALFLERGKPVAVTIVNQSTDHAAVHWHGIELDSYPDGVPGWSGSGRKILPSVAPRDSITVTWTPPRSGSFMYHSHFSEFAQMGAGLYGPIIVAEPGEKFDAETDRILFFGTAGSPTNVIVGPFPKFVLNGKEQPEPMELKAGTRYRFRLFNLAGDVPLMVSMTQGARPMMWRHVAKDGFSLPEVQRVEKPAMLFFDPGEIYDFEFTPAVRGELTLSFGLPPFLQGPPPQPPGAPPLPPIQFPPTVNVAVHVR